MPIISTTAPPLSLVSTGGVATPALAEDAGFAAVLDIEIAFVTVVSPAKAALVQLSVQPALAMDIPPTIGAIETDKPADAQEERSLAEGDHDAVPAIPLIPTLVAPVVVIPMALPVAMPVMLPVALPLTVPVAVRAADPSEPLAPSPKLWSRKSPSTAAAPTIVAQSEQPAEPSRVAELVAVKPDILTVQNPQPISFPEIRSLSHNPPVSVPAPLDRLFAALTQTGSADRQWLDTVIRDVAVSASPSGAVRFQIAPDGLGKVTVDRTADHLKVGVSEANAITVVDAARAHILAGANALGVPVSGASVVHDQSGGRHREDHRPRPQIEHRRRDDEGEPYSSETGRYA